MGFGDPVNNSLAQTIPSTTDTALNRNADTGRVTTVSNNGGGGLAINVSSIPLPIASFSVSYFSDGIVYFNNTSLYGASYAWNFGDGATSTEKSPYHRYAATGSYSVVLAVTNSSGTRTYPATVVVTSVQAAANFTATPAGLTVYFNNTSTATGTAFWNFGDGTTGIGDRPSHTYAAAGTYLVTLTIGVFSKTVNVVAYNPVDPGVYQGISGAFSVSSSFLCVLDDYVALSKANNPDYVSRIDKTTLAQFDTFGSRGSLDGQFLTPRRTCADATYYYVGDLGNGRVQVFVKATKAFDSKFGTSGEGDGQFYFPTGIAVGDVYVYVTDYKIVSNVFYWSRISIWNKTTKAWVANIAGGEGSNQFRQPTDIHIANGKIYIADYSNNKIIVHDQTTRAYLATITIPLGAGNGQVLTGISMSFGVDSNYFYIGEQGGNRIQLFRESDGLFSSGFAVNDAGATSSYDVAIDNNSIYVYSAGSYKISKYDKIGNPAKIAPAALFTASVMSGAAPLSVVFSNKSTGTGLTYAWNFGDGATSTSASPTHIYTSPGNYKVSLTATNDTGSSVKEMYISATAIDTTINTPIAASMTILPPLATAGATVSFFATTSASITAYAWDFGDGTTGSGATPTHVYAASGTYTVKLTVTTVDGLTTTSTKQVVVSADTAPANNPPVAMASMSSAFAVAPSDITFTASTYADVPASFEWDFGNGVLMQGQSVKRNYSTPGTYIVTLRAWNVYGQTTTKVVLIVAGLLSLSSDTDGYYIIDKQNHQILQYSLAGTFIRSAGGLGSIPGKLNNPTKLCVCRPRIAGG